MTKRASLTERVAQARKRSVRSDAVIVLRILNRVRGSSMLARGIVDASKGALSHATIEGFLAALQAKGFVASRESLTLGGKLYWITTLGAGALAEEEKVS